MGEAAVDVLATAALDLVAAADSLVGVATEMMLLAGGMAEEEGDGEGEEEGGMDADGLFVGTALGLVQNSIDVTLALGKSDVQIQYDKLEMLKEMFHNPPLLQGWSIRLWA